ncbi:MAG TPA: DUF4266 domain-containing protein [Opitutaceae bacterium]|nr:DUF4266 domain-containing protein [Opitutaceae bacterium]
MKRIILALLILSALFGYSGCTTVQPWQRATLAEYSMRSDRDPLGDGQMDHIYTSREAASGGRGVGRSGCGCQ